jgi:hypothetical protein
MALQFLDGADHLSAVTNAGGFSKWNALVPTNTVEVIQPGRGGDGGQYYVGTDFWYMVAQSLPVEKGYIVGWAAKYARHSMVPADGSDILRVGILTVNQCSIALRRDGSLTAYRNRALGGTVLGSSVASVIPEAFLPVQNAFEPYVYIEARVYVDTTAGEVEVRTTLSGTTTTVLNLSAINTANWTDDQRVSWIAIESTADGVIDDIYVLDTETSGATSFLGECHVETLHASANGATIQWTSTEANNFDAINTNSAGVVSTAYNYTSTVSNIDTFSHITYAAGSSTNIHAVQVAIVGAMDATSSTVRGVAVVSGNTYFASLGAIAIQHGVQSGTAMCATHTVFRFETNPDLASHWAEGDFASAEFGYELMSNA